MCSRIVSSIKLALYSDPIIRMWVIFRWFDTSRAIGVVTQNMILDCVVPCVLCVGTCVSACIRTSVNHATKVKPHIELWSDIETVDRPITTQSFLSMTNTWDIYCVLHVAFNWSRRPKAETAINPLNANLFGCDYIRRMARPATVYQPIKA